MPAKYRDVIYLFYFEEYSALEIASILQKKENTIYTWLNRGRKMLEPKKAPFYRHPIYRVAVACLVLVALVGVGLATTSQKSVKAAYVQMDGAVQIGLTLDENNQVVKVTGINDAGKQVLKEVAATGLSYEEALQQIMQCDTYESEQGEEAKITVDCEDEDQQSTLETTGNEACENYQKHYRKQHGKQSQTSQQDCEEQTDCVPAGVTQGTGNGQGNGGGQGNGNGQGNASQEMSSHNQENHEGGNGGNGSGGNSNHGNGGNSGGKHGNSHE